jgi:hypothetical protein
MKASESTVLPSVTSLPRPAAPNLNRYGRILASWVRTPVSDSGSSPGGGLRTMMP